MARPDRLPVAVSDGELHEIDAADTFESAGTFVVAVTNHGRDAHVHLNLDDELAAVATLAESNVYVERDATREVEVTVDPDADHATGHLGIETGYGANSDAVEVTVGSDDDPVAVDESLGEPPADADADDDPATGESGGGPGLPEGWVPVALLAAVALALAGATAALVDSPVVVAGVAVVCLGVLAAAVILLWR